MRRNTTDIYRLVRGLLFLPVPLIAIVIAGPIAAGPLLDPRGSWPVLWLIASPAYVGLICAPGYIYTAVARPRASELVALRRWWVRLSLIGAMLCSLGGIAGGYWMILFAPPSLLSLGMVAYLLWDFERGGRRPSPPPAPNAP